MDPTELNDDSRKALGWYLRLRLSQELDRHVLQTEIAAKSGLAAARLSYLKRDARGAGLETAIGFARYFNCTPGELLDAAIDWWEKRGGREHAQSELARMAAEQAAEIEAAAKKSPSSDRWKVSKLHRRPRKDTGSDDTDDSSNKK